MAPPSRPPFQPFLPPNFDTFCKARELSSCLCKPKPISYVAISTSASNVTSIALNTKLSAVAFCDSNGFIQLVLLSDIDKLVSLSYPVAHKEFGHPHYEVPEALGEFPYAYNNPTVQLDIPESEAAEMNPASPQSVLSHIVNQREYFSGGVYTPAEFHKPVVLGVNWDKLLSLSYPVQEFGHPNDSALEALGEIPSAFDISKVLLGIPGFEAAVSKMDSYARSSLLSDIQGEYKRLEFSNGVGTSIGFLELGFVKHPTLIQQDADASVNPLLPSQLLTSIPVANGQSLTCVLCPGRLLIELNRFGSTRGGAMRIDDPNPYPSDNHDYGTVPKLYRLQRFKVDDEGDRVANGEDEALGE